jgi:PAS domain-containing protein
VIVGDARQAMPQPSWVHSGAHLLDDAWLLTIFAILFATALPWLLSDFDLNFLAVSLGLLALGAIHLSFSALGRRSRVAQHRRLLKALHAAGMCIIGFVWMNAGGLQNPAFLTVFVLPVLSGIFLSRWPPYFMAVLAIVLACTVALAQIPELRWYVPGVGMVGAWLASVSEAPFRGFYAPSGYYIVLLEVFAISILAAAVASEYLGAIVERLRAHLELVRGEAENSQAFWSTLIQDLPAPAFLVEPETLRVVHCSELTRELCGAAPAQDRSILATVRFSYPDVIQELIAGDGGVLPLAMIHVENRLIAAEVRVRHTLQNGRRLAVVMIEDKTEGFSLRAALDVIGQAALIIDHGGRVVDFNKPSLALFPGLQKNANAAALLALPGAAEQWWAPGLTGRRKMHVEITPRTYQVTTSVLQLPGEDAHLYVATFLPVARPAVNEHTVLQATTQTPGPISDGRLRPTMASRK